MIAEVLTRIYESGLASQTYYSTNFLTFKEKFQLLEQQLGDKFYDVFVPFSMKKGELLLKQGRVSKKVWFLGSGFAYVYRSTCNEDKVIAFHLPGEWIDKYESSTFGCPSTVNIRLVCNTQGYVADWDELNRLKPSFPIMYDLEKIIVSSDLNQKESLKSSLVGDAAADYAFLKKNYSVWIDHFPSVLIASYLNVSQEHLSRIRAQLLTGKNPPRF